MYIYRYVDMYMYVYTYIYTPNQLKADNAGNTRMVLQFIESSPPHFEQRCCLFLREEGTRGAIDASRAVDGTETKKEKKTSRFRVKIRVNPIHA